MVMQYQKVWFKMFVRGEVVVIADRIRILREEKGMTQTELSKKLGISRSGVNAWEMGISVPSTQYIVELSNVFKVSTDYLLGMDENVSVCVKGLTDADIKIVYGLVEHLKIKNETK